MIRCRLTPALGALFLAACGAASEPRADEERRDDRPAGCPETAQAPSTLPGIRDEHLSLEYWLRQTAGHGDLDEPLLTTAQVADHNAALAVERDEHPPPRQDLLAPIDPVEMRAHLNERLGFLHERLESREYVEANGAAFQREKLSEFSGIDALPTLIGTYHVGLEPIQVKCGPYQGSFYTASLDLRFDRNNCSSVRPHELVQQLYRWPNGMRVIRTGSTIGFVPDSVPLSPALDRTRARALALGPHALAVRDLGLTSSQGVGARVTEGTLLALVPDDSERVLFGTSSGLEVSQPLSPSDIQASIRPLTRRTLLTEAFRLLDEPYGWGGQNGGRDCSQFLLDVFSTFGLHLPRYSGHQAGSGTFQIDVGGLDNEREKLLLIDSAARRGIVLLQFPGHIMLYLGRAEDGRPMAIHAFAEYVAPCANDSSPPTEELETLYKVDRITVSDLELGRGSSRTSFAERITHITVFGHPPDIELGGVAELRPAAPVTIPANESCDDSMDVAVFRSPSRPNSDQPLRVIITSEHDPGPVELVLVDPDGETHRPTVHRLGSPPWTYWTEVPSPAAGTWTAVLGDGARMEACESFAVYPQKSPVTRGRNDVAWEPRWRWEQDTENLFAAFIEQLFREPVDEDVTWQGLQVLIEDPSRNLLHDHLSLGEDENLRLEPDCADLPYSLRAYFAWKTRLPFGFRPCNRGRAGQPPTCGEPRTNMETMDPMSDASAGRDLLRRVAGTVHSASARTHPADDDTDLYPVALSRETLRPGTVFADPYGHLLVIAGWLPQGIDNYGIMIGADAQPDGTVGRRRFWRGSFLFTPETTDAGAGFKAWRPMVQRGNEVVPIENEALRTTTRYAPYSMVQYEGSADDFYDRMEALINPRPLDPTALQMALVDALEESVARRINSVDNGEQFMASRRYATIDMPTGHAIFETSGPWEDFSTPSRDMRLLISMDAVLNFPGSVSRGPERFALTADDVASTVASLEALLERELRRRTFSYTRSDGSSHTMSLADVIARRQAMEIAYNPNDCVEIRWGATESSPDYATCRRHAPAQQLARMREYRPWFQNRQRPPR